MGHEDAKKLTTAVEDPVQKIIDQFQKALLTATGGAAKKAKVKPIDVATAADINALAAAAIKGGVSQAAALAAGKSAASMLSEAAKGSTAAGRESESVLKRYGATAQGANGQLASMTTILKQLAPAFAKMTHAQQEHTAAMIFGKQAADAMVTAIDNIGKAATKTATATTAAKDAAKEANIALEQALYDQLKMSQGQFGNMVRAGQISGYLPGNAPALPFPGTTPTGSPTSRVGTGPFATSNSSSAAPSIVVQSGAIVIHAQQSSKSEVVDAVNAAFRRLTSELKSGVSTLSG